MRIDEPFGDTQRQSLWLYQVVEPDMWSKIVARVAGANTGALYGQESGNILGNRYIRLPERHTWETFANLLLDTMPPEVSEHYKNKIAVYINWYKVRGYEDGIPDQADYKLETYNKAPSWRRICKTLLRNDYWCKSLGQTQPKSDAYIQFKEIRAKRKMEKEIDKAIINQVEIF
jgi:predicted phosphoadenosine phosphosulfate sulfurtransferase